MGLSELAAEKPKELWTSAVNTKTGEVMTWIKETTDLVRLDKEEHEVATSIYAKLNAWLAADPANKEKIKDYKQAFQMDHTDGNIYRIVQQREGGYKISRWKQKGSGGKGGFQRQPFIHLRIEQIKMVHVEEANDLINKQEANDNWSVQVLNRLDEEGGPLFVMTNSRPYTPKVEGESATNEEADKEEDHQEG